MYRKNKSEFCPSYVQKVEFEFVNSIKENEPVEQDNDNDDDDVMDDALNAMLEAKMDGFDGFNDDFEELSDIDLPTAEDYTEDEEEDEGFF